MVLPKKEIMTLKYLKFRENTLLLNKFNIYNLLINSGVNPKLATLAPKGESNAK